MRFADIRLKQHKSRPLTHLVINRDADTDVQAAAPSAASVQAVQELVSQFDPNANQTSKVDWQLEGEAITVSLVSWAAKDPQADGLPEKQTLERLVSAAVLAAYPERGPAVQKWLDVRPEAPGAGPKEFAWSYMAGWYAEGGCEYFYRRVWTDPRIAAELEARLMGIDAWRVAEVLAQ